MAPTVRNLSYMPFPSKGIVAHVPSPLPLGPTSHLLHQAQTSKMDKNSHKFYDQYLLIDFNLHVFFCILVTRDNLKSIFLGYSCIEHDKRLRQIIIIIQYSPDY